ncbi:hypothetical protein ES703_122036 [subsurface metagenome]
MGQPRNRLPPARFTNELRLICIEVGKQQITFLAREEHRAVHVPTIEHADGISLLVVDHKELSGLRGLVRQLEAGPSLRVHPERAVVPGVVQQTGCREDMQAHILSTFARQNIHFNLLQLGRHFLLTHIEEPAFTDEHVRIGPKYEEGNITLTVHVPMRSFQQALVEDFACGWLQTIDANSAVQICGASRREVCHVVGHQNTAVDRPG